LASSYRASFEIKEQGDTLTSEDNAKTEPDDSSDYEQDPPPPPPSKPNEVETDPKNEREGIGKQKTNPPETDSEDRITRKDWLMFIAQVGLIVVGAIALYIYGKQLNVMQGQLDAMNEAERPWVSVDNVSAGVPTNKPQPMSIDVTNSGRGPAKITEVLWHQNVYRLFPDTPNYGDVSSLPSQFILVPGQHSSSSSSSMVFSKHNLAVLERGGYRLYTFGIVHYLNVADNNEHITEFCVFYDVVKKTWHLCHTYNEAN
jgi:hypothetical protein